MKRFELNALISKTMNHIYEPPPPNKKRKGWQQEIGKGRENFGKGGKKMERKWSKMKMERGEYVGLAMNLVVVGVLYIYIYIWPKTKRDTLELKKSEPALG